MNWDFEIYKLMLLFLILREVLMLLLLESSGYQRQDGIKHPQQVLHISLLGDTQMSLHILQEVKANEKSGMTFLTH
jgi:hypothetical protein